nr:hypothetical protein [Candidatus Amoebophilus asiaticus]
MSTIKRKKKTRIKQGESISCMHNKLKTGGLYMALCTNRPAMGKDKRPLTSPIRHSRTNSQK